MSTQTETPAKPIKAVECPRCHGTGELMVPMDRNRMSREDTRGCEECVCPRCYGYGAVRVCDAQD